MAYTRMDEGTAEDYAIEMQVFRGRLTQTADAVLAQLELLKGDPGGGQIDRYDHSLQTATRALRDGADEDMVVAALLHDVGDGLAPANHAELAAAILRPFVHEKAWWVVQHHGIFQGYYFFHHVGADRHLRDSYRSEEHFAACVRFCERWDMRSFDPDYPTETLETFLPSVQSVFSRTPSDLVVPGGEVTPTDG